MKDTWTISMRCDICNGITDVETGKTHKEVFDVIDGIDFTCHLYCKKCEEITPHKFLCIGISGETKP